MLTDRTKMNKIKNEDRDVNLIGITAFLLIALAVSSGATIETPTTKVSLVVKAQVSTKPFNPIVEDMVVPIYNWESITLPPPPPPPPPAPVAPKFVVPANVHVDPGSAQDSAKNLALAQGWGDDQFACLHSLWAKESGWRANAANTSSGAYGIPQALPGSKMASSGADWETNPETQIKWGLGYIGSRYGNPCSAWAHSVASGWY